MPVKRSTKAKAGSSSHLSNNEPCIICGKVVSRASDIKRHMSKHDSDADAKKISCPWEDCTFRTLQQSNFNTHYRRHTKNKSEVCKDDPQCSFRTCDPASLLRHRVRLHGYVPRPSAPRKSKPYKAPARCGREASVDSSSVTSPFSVESRSNTLASLSPSPSPSSFSPPCSSPSGESESNTSISSSSAPDTPSSSPFDGPMASTSYPKSLLFFNGLPPCSYNYAWDTFLPELQFLTAEPATDFQYPCQYQQEESQAKDSYLPLQFPNMEQVFPGYQTTGQLHGSHGLNFGFEQLPQQASSREMNDDTWFGLSIGGSKCYNLPAKSFQTPVNCSQEIYSSGSPELYTEATLDSGFRFDSSLFGNTEFPQMKFSSFDFNSVFNPTPKLAEPAVFTDATNPQLHQVSSASTQAHASSDGFGNWDPCQLANLNGDLFLHQADANPSLIELSASNLDYFNQCQWEFGFNFVQELPGGGSENALIFSS